MSKTTTTRFTIIGAGAGGLCAGIKLKESGQDADTILDSMLKVCQGKTRVLVASLRSAEQIVALAARGHDTFTIAPAVFDAFMDVPQTQQATAEFEAAASMLRKDASSKGGFFNS